ncbi:MAG: hypothetical protein Q4P23_08060 [Micrococcaceae bacterium]|nr:hypothetical protein [Micrococcaceae bacterium]
MKDPDLLEIRIHGVRNTPAHRMLQVPAAKLLMGRGDAAAGFSTVADPAPGEPEADHRLEAYSWGQLARSTGLPQLGRVGDAAVRVIWFALAPFGLVNTAFWSRARVLDHPLGIDGQEEPVDGREQIARLGSAVNAGPGTGTIRFVGLLLTLMLVVTAASITMRFDTDMLFKKFSPLRNWTPGQDLALAGLVCAAGVLVIWALPKLANISFMPVPHLPGPTASPAKAQDAATPPPADASRPLVAHRHFWEIGSGTAGLAVNHLTASFALLAGLVAGSYLAAAALPEAERDAGIGWWIVVAAAAATLFLFSLVRSVKYEHSSHLDLSVLVAGSAVLATALALSAWGPSLPMEDNGTPLVAAALVLALVIALGMVRARCSAGSSGDREPEQMGWGGRGPFVFAALATGFALLLSFAAVQLAALVPGGPPPPMVYVLSSLGFVLLVGTGLIYVLVRWPTRGGPRGEEMDAVDTSLRISSWQGVDGWMKQRARERVWKSRRFTSLMRRAEPIAGATARLLVLSTAVFAVLALAWELHDASSLGEFGTKLENTETWVRFGGGFGLWVALVALLGLVLMSSKTEARPIGLLWDLMCFLPVQGHPFGPPCYSTRVAPELADRVGDWLAGADDQYTRPGKDGRQPQRPAYPLTANPQRRVVISAHSMGMVLTVCMLFHARADGSLGEEEFKRIAVLSYGVQLRRYFGRFFPSILGPELLSVVPAGPPETGSDSRNPWPIDAWPRNPGDQPEVSEEDMAAAIARDRAGGPWPLSRILEERWINLYRPNDPLGFGLHYIGAWPRQDNNPMRDRPAEEFVRDAYQFTVAGHGFYLPTDAYRQGITDVKVLVAPREPTGGAGPGS